MMMYQFQTGFSFTDKEHRLLCEKPNLRSRLHEQFNEQETLGNVRPTELRERLRGRAANYADEVATDAIDNPFGGRADAPPIDEAYAEALAKDSVNRLLNMRTLRQDPQMRALIYKAYAIMELYQGDGEELTDAVFGLQGGKLVVQNIDPERLEWAITEVQGQIDYLKGNKSPRVDITKSRYETQAEFEARLAAVQQYRQKSVDYDPNYRQEQMNQWAEVQQSLIDYQSDFKQYREIAEAAEAAIDDPEQLQRVMSSYSNQQLLEFGKKYPKLYRKIIKRVAKRDPSFLAGKEVQLVGLGNGAEAKGMYEYMEMFEEIAAEDPSAVLYYPDRLKRSNVAIQKNGKTVTTGPNRYRELFIEAVANDASLLKNAQAEFDDIWKENPAEYSNLVVAAITKEPTLFFSPAKWQMSEFISDFRAVATKLDVATMTTLVEQLNASNVNVLEGANYSGGYRGFIKDVLVKAAPDGDASNADAAAMRAIVLNTWLFQKIRAEDTDLYQEIRERAVDIADPEMRRLLGEAPELSADEDVAEGVLTNLITQLADKNPEEVAQIIRENDALLQNLPDYVTANRTLGEQFKKLIIENGDLMRYAPDDWKDNAEFALRAAMRNASVYQHLSPRLRGETSKDQEVVEILYAALFAEERSSSGEFQWRSVGAELRKYLNQEGLPGVPTEAELDDFLDGVILGQKLDDTLSADDVHSLMDLWDEDRKKDKNLVAAYLRRNSDRPEFIVDMDESLMADLGFVEGMLIGDGRFPGNINYFKYLDHEVVYNAYLATGNDAKYRGLVKSAVLDDITNIEYVAPALAQDVDFLWDIADTSPAIRFADLVDVIPAELRGSPAFIDKVLDRLNSTNPTAALDYIEREILPDPIYTGTGVIERLLLANDAALLIQMLEKNPTFYASPRISRDALRPRLLETIVDWMLVNRPTQLRPLLDHVDPKVKQQYLERNPSILFAIFKNSPTGLVDYVGEEALTVDVLRQLFENYDTTQINSVTAQVLRKKPNVMVGVLRSWPELWFDLSPPVQEQLKTALGIDVPFIEDLIARENAANVERQTEQREQQLNSLKANIGKAIALKSLVSNLNTMPEVQILGEKMSVRRAYRKLDTETKKINFKTVSIQDLYAISSEWFALERHVREHMETGNIDQAAIQGLSIPNPYGITVRPENLSTDTVLSVQLLRSIALKNYFYGNKDRNTVILDRLKTLSGRMMNEVKDSNLAPKVTARRAYEAEYEQLYLKIYRDRLGANVSEAAMFNQNMLVARQLQEDTGVALRPLSKDLPPEQDAYYNMTTTEYGIVDGASRYLGIDRVQAAVFIDGLGQGGAEFARQLAAVDTAAEWGQLNKIYTKLNLANGANTVPQKMESVRRAAAVLDVQHAAGIIESITVPAGFNALPIAPWEQAIRHVNRKLPDGWTSAGTGKDMAQNALDAYIAGGNLKTPEWFARQKTADLIRMVRQDMIGDSRLDYDGQQAFVVLKDKLNSADPTLGSAMEVYMLTVQVARVQPELLRTDGSYDTILRDFYNRIVEDATIDLAQTRVNALADLLDVDVPDFTVPRNSSGGSPPYTLVDPF